LKRFKFQGARRRLAAVEQPRAGSVLELARPEMADGVLRDLTIRGMTSELDEGSWDFDGSVSTLARNRTRRSPMPTHETSPVLGASVVGMTIRVGQGQSHLPADVPGISTALSQRGRLQLKGRLVTPLLGARASEDDETPPTAALPKAARAPTRSTEAGDKHDASHARPPPTNGQDPPP
jgi:hypothetical protein